MSEQQPVPPARGLVAEFFDKRRMAVVLAVLLVELALFVVGLLTPMSASTQHSLSQQVGTQFAPIKSAGFSQEVLLIFSHNLAIALGEMVPFLGALLLLFSMYTTGLVAQALVVAQGLPGPAALFLFAFPYSLVELSAYAIATGAGVMVLASWRRKRLRRELRVLVLEGVAVVCVLLLAATMETTTTYSPLLGLALWLPTAPALAAVLVIGRRARRERAESAPFAAKDGTSQPVLVGVTGATPDWDARAAAFELAYRESHPEVPPAQAEAEKKQDA